MEDSRLARLTKICLALPGAAREMHGSHATFRIRGKIFAYFVSDHHGDGIVGLWCKVLPCDNATLIAADPAKFYMPAYVGPRGWVGLRLDRGPIDWEEAAELVRGSYSLVTATKKKVSRIRHQVSGAADGRHLRRET